LRGIPANCFEFFLLSQN